MRHLIYTLPVLLVLAVALIGFAAPATATADSWHGTTLSVPRSFASGCAGSNCLMKKYINPAINLLTIMFGLIAVISLILGSINFITSEGDPQKASSAKNRIANTLLAIFVYLFLYSFLQFIIPGGLFHGGG